MGKGGEIRQRQAGLTIAERSILCNALERDLDSNLSPVDVVPQELIRVLLNLIGKGLYAANKRSSESDRTYRPALKVTTRELGESVEVRVRDNGVGVPPENRDKLFQHFLHDQADRPG